MWAKQCSIIHTGHWYGPYCLSTVSKSRHSLCSLDSYSNDVISFWFLHILLWIIIVFYCSFIGKTSRCRYLDRHIHWLLFHSICRTSIFSVLSSQCWTTLLHSSFTTIWTPKWSVHCKILLRRMSDWLIDWLLLFVGDIASFQQMYTNIFDYPLYIGICLLLMLVYSVMYFFLAIYVERLNPGEFGVAQPWNYLCKRSKWKGSTIRPETSNIDKDLGRNGNGAAPENHWLELTRQDRKKQPAMTIDHLNKVTLSFFQEHVLISCLFRNSANSMLSLISRLTSTKVKCVHF